MANIPSRMLEKHLARSSESHRLLQGTHSPLLNPRSTRLEANGRVRGEARTRLPDRYVRAHLSTHALTYSHTRAVLASLDRESKILLDDISTQQRRATRLYGPLTDYIPLKLPEATRRQRFKVISALRRADLVDITHTWESDKTTSRVTALLVNRVYRNNGHSELLDDAEWLQTRITARANTASGLERAALANIWQHYEENGLWPSAQILAGTLEAHLAQPEGLLAHLEKEGLIARSNVLDSEETFVVPLVGPDTVPLLAAEIDFSNRLVTDSWLHQRQKTTQQLSETEARVWQELLKRSFDGSGPATLTDLIDETRPGFKFRANVHAAFEKLEALGFIIRTQDPMPGSRAEYAIVLKNQRGDPLAGDAIHKQVQELHDRTRWVARLRPLSKALFASIQQAPEAPTFAELRKTQLETTPHNIRESLKLLLDMKLILNIGSQSTPKYAVQISVNDSIETFSLAQGLQDRVRAGLNDEPTAIALEIQTILWQHINQNLSPPSILALAWLLEVSDTHIANALHELEVHGTLIMIPDPMTASALLLPILTRDEHDLALLPRDIAAQVERLNSKQRWEELLGPTQKQVLDVIKAAARPMRYTEMYALLPNIHPSKIREACLNLRKYGLVVFEKMPNGRDVNISAAGN
jgi:hypothetical protein